MNIRVLNLSFGTAVAAELPARPAGLRRRGGLAQGHRGRGLRRQRRHRHRQAAQPGAGPVRAGGRRRGQCRHPVDRGRHHPGVLHPRRRRPQPRRRRARQVVAGAACPGLLHRHPVRRYGGVRGPLLPRQRHVAGGRSRVRRGGAAAPAAPVADAGPGQGAAHRHRDHAAGGRRAGPGQRLGEREHGDLDARPRRPSSCSRSRPGRAASTVPAAQPSWCWAESLSPARRTSSARRTAATLHATQEATETSWTGGTWNGSSWAGLLVGRLVVGRLLVGRLLVGRVLLGRVLLGGFVLGHRCLGRLVVGGLLVGRVLVGRVLVGGLLVGRFVLGHGQPGAEASEGTVETNRRPARAQCPAPAADGCGGR